MKKRLGIFLCAWLVASIALQVMCGNGHTFFLSFPVNVAALAAITGGLYVAQKERPHSPFLHMLASTSMSICVLILFVAACLVLGLVPQTEGSDSMLHDFTSSIIFQSVVLLLMAHLTLVTLRYRKHGRRRWRFLLNHIGLLTALSGLCLGAADTHCWRAVIPIGESTDRAYDSQGNAHPLGYTFKLSGFSMSCYENGTPADFAAESTVDGTPAHISVNHPWQATWKDDIYLVGYDTKAGARSSYCVMEFVRQPWKHVILAGIIMLAAGAALMFWNGQKESL